MSRAAPRQVRPAVLAALAVAIVAPPSAAAAEGVLEEIVVSARKREERLQDVPIAVLSVSGERLAQQNIGRLEQLTATLPNVHVGESGVLDNVFIRGIGSGTNQGFEQSVGTFQDGLYFGRSRSSRGPFLDVARVEVLKGPQSILFGKNTVAGALNITSAAPADTAEGSVTGLYGQDGEYGLTGVLSGPLTDAVGARLAVRASGMDGFVENAALGRDEPSTDERAARLTAVWKPGDATAITGRIEWAEFDTTGRQSEISQCSAQLATIVRTRQPAEDCTFDARKTSWGVGPYGQEESTSETITSSVTVEHDFGPVVLTAQTGWVNYDYRDLSQPTSSLPVLLLDVREAFDQYSQELRLASAADARVGWTGGLYWQKADLDAIFDTNVNPAGAGFPFPSGNRANDFNQSATTYAAFAQAAVPLASAWTLTAGVRWTREEKDVTKRQVIALPFERTPTTNPGVLGFFRAVLGSTNHFLEGERSESNWSPSLQLQWRPSENAMTYASATRGFKGGGFDALLPNGDPRFFEYKPEEATAYEVGVKSTLLDGRLRANVAVFRSEFDDLQVSTFDGALSFVVGNAAKAISQGVELEGAWQITPSLRLDLVAAYLDSTYDDYRNASCWFGQTAAQGCVGGVQDLSGEPTQFAPEWSGSVGVNYEVPVGAVLLRAGVDANFTTGYFIPSDNDPNVEQGGFGKLNARLAIADPNDRWELAVIGRNLTDRLTTHWGNDLPLFNGSYFKFVDRPRSVAAQATWRF
jgi:outer membrane receptor protein involved in Fe transport